MNEELVIVGKVINFFGIKGELKILSDFDKEELAFKCGMHVLIKEEWLSITSVRKHKNYILIRVNNLNDINLVTKYIGFNVYIRKSDLNLGEDEYLLDDLIGARVIDEKNNIGEVIDAYIGPSSSYVKVLYENKEYLIPLVDAYIKKFDKNNKILYTTNAKDLII